MKDVIHKYYGYQEEISKSEEVKKYIPNCVRLASLGDGSWEPVAMALLSGFFDQTFVNSSYLGDSEDYYIRLMNDFKQKVMLSPDSSLCYGNKQPKAKIIIAKDIMFVKFEETLEDYGNVSIAGSLKAEWVKHPFKHCFEIDEKEVDKISQAPDLKIIPKSIIGKNIYNVTVEGPAGKVIEYEHNTLEKLKIPLHVIEFKKIIEEELCNKNKEMAKIYKDNYQKIKNDHGRFFRSFFRKWEKLYQVKMSFRNEKIEIQNARIQQIRVLESQVIKFKEWFEKCNEINCQGIKGHPYTLDKNKPEYKAIRARIERITNPDRDLLELKNYASGPIASRVTRMELVCWILINNFDCTVEGGFVRDWIVAGRNEWQDGIKLKQIKKKWDFDENDQKKISPKDIDVYLSLNKIFDQEKFKRELTKLGITVEFDENDGWRTYCVFDRDCPWPFTADLIEPYQQVCQDSVDMDVSNLYVKGSYTGELGLRTNLDNLEVQGGASESITVDMIIENIQNKIFTVLRPRDTKYRIKKFEDRGWKESTKKFVQKTGKMSRFELRSTDLLYQYAVKMMSKMPEAKIVKVFSVGNKALDKIYEGMRETMMRTNDGEINEENLYHGTSSEGAEGILANSFDERRAKDGAWGYGFYFADDPNKSHSFAPPDQSGIRNILICNVLLGKKNIKNKSQNGLHSAEPGYDSVVGTGFKFTEYIVYRYGQAKPFLWIEYK